MTTTRIELLRHGLPEGDNSFRGQTDFALTEKGLGQMYASVVNSVTPELVITSPLSRCHRFASEFASQHGIPLLEEPGLMELNFGDWDGRPKQEVWEEQQQMLSQFWSEPWNTVPPNGESLHDFDRRIQQAWNGVLAQYKDKSILVVTHGGVIKQILRFLLDMPKTEVYIQRLNIPYAAKVCVTIYHDENGKHWPEIHWPMI